MKRSVAPLVVMILTVIFTISLIIAFPAIAREMLESSFLENSLVQNYPYQTITDCIVSAGVTLLGQMIIGATGIICFLISFKWLKETKAKKDNANN